MRPHNLLFRQLFEQVSCTYTYIIGCSVTRKAVIIDPVIDTVERDAQLLHELELDLIYGVNTHVHADHITATGVLRQLHFPRMKSVISGRSQAKADWLIRNGEILKFGNKSLEARETPGHTNGCASYVLHDDRMVFTGDALLIRGCGRTDFQEGNARTLYQSVHSQILSLPDDFLIYPAHDYKGITASTVAEEKRFNPRLSKSESEFVTIMQNLQLSYPKQFDKSVPANLVCGILEGGAEAKKHGKAR